MARQVSVEQSRLIPIEPMPAFELTLPMPLTVLFARRYGLLPPIKEVTGQDGIWNRVGQSRTIVTTDGGTMRELLVGVDPPHSFSYRLSDITGPIRPIVESVDGRWQFVSQGTGIVVTWRWTLYPRGLGAAAMPLITPMWRGYARQALERLSDQLLSAGSPPG